LFLPYGAALPRAPPTAAACRGGRRRRGWRFGAAGRHWPSVEAATAVAHRITLHRFGGCGNFVRGDVGAGGQRLPGHHNITNTWPGGFGTNVSVTNLGTPITSWQLSWSFATGQSITQLWSGTYTQSGTQVSVANASYNGSLATGGSTSGTTCTGTVTTTPPTSPTTTPPPTTPPTSPPTTFSNPVLWEDLADADVLRVGDTYYYYSASTMHYSPGAPILRSYDLVHWEFAGHSVPSLDFGEKYNLNGNGRAWSPDGD
jgi:hypothetical protein